MVETLELIMVFGVTMLAAVTIFPVADIRPAVLKFAAVALPVAENTLAFAGGNVDA